MGVARGAALWATIGNWIQQGFSLITVLVIARLLDPESFGLLAVALLFVLLFQRILLESIGYLIVQRSALSAEFLDSAFIAAVAVGAVLGTGLFVARDWVAHAFGYTALAPVLAAMALMPLFEGLGVVHSGLLRRESGFKALAMRTFTANMLASGIGIVMALNGFGVWSLVVQQLGQSLAGVVMLWRSHAWRPGRQATGDEMGKVLRFGGPMAANAVVFVVTNRIDVALLGAYAGAGATGIYSIAKRLSRAVTDLLASGISTASLTSLSSAGDDEPKFRQVLDANLRLVAWISYPAFAGLMLVSERLVPLMLGAQWNPTVPALQVLCLFGVLQVPQLVTSNALVAAGKTKTLTALNMVGLACFLIVAFAMPQIDATSVAWAFVVQALITLLIQAVLLWKLLSMPLTLMGRATVAPVLGSLLAGGAGWLLLTVPAVRAWPAAGVIGAQVGAFVLVYVLVSLLLNQKQLKQVSARFIRKRKHGGN